MTATVTGYAMEGLEALSLELFATLSAYDAAARTSPLDPVVDSNGRASASLIIFQMRGLRLWGLPGVDYFEALWRVKVKFQNAPAWLAVACDIDKPLPRAAAGRLVRYPTRAAEIACVESGESLSASVGAGFEAQLTQTGSLASAPALPLVVAIGRQIFTVPFGSKTGRGLVKCDVALTRDALWKKTFGPSARISSALLQWDRPHECGLAKPVR